MFRTVSPFLSIIVFMLMALSILATSAQARSRSRNRNSGAAAAAAKRKAMIASLQLQIAEAKKVLAAAESNVQMSQSEVSAAVGKLQSIASEMKGMNTEHDSQLRALHEREKQVLDGVAEGSPLDKADDNLEDKLQALDHTFHSATGISQHEEPATSASRAAELRSLTPEQKKALEIHAGFLEAQKDVKNAVSNLEHEKMEVLKADSEWARLHAEYVESSKSLRSSKGQGQGAALDSLKAHQGLNKSQKLADAAREFIAQGELKIRQLGGTPASSSSSKGSSTSKKK